MTTETTTQDITTIPQHFEQQAKACDSLGSPFTAKLCRALIQCLDDSTRTGRRVLNWTGNPRWDALALRLCGGLHALSLANADPALAAIYPPAEIDQHSMAAALPAILARNDGALVRSLDNAPQTNETARAGMLLPGFLRIAERTRLPLALNEIGASAGLNMLFDRFHYTYGDTLWGDALSAARLSPEIRGKRPPLDGTPIIATRQGCDIAPVDLADAAARLRLRSYIWADQDVRLRRLDAAIAIAGSVPIPVDRMNAADFIRRQLAGREAGTAFVLFHSVMWQYMPEAERDDIEAQMQAEGRNAGADDPIAWLRMEPMALADPYCTLSLTLWPDGNTRHLARCDFHGRWIEWLD